MSKLIATVDALIVRDKQQYAPTETRALIEVSLEGIVGDVHGGFIRPSDARDKGIIRGTPVRNWRQWSAVSREELAVIAKNMGIDQVDGRALSANFVFSGIPNFTQIPKGSSIIFENGVILMVEDENEPCVGPGKEISALYPDKKPHDFVKNAINLRGLVGVVYRAGVVRVGEMAEVVVCEPKTYHMVGNQA